MQRARAALVDFFLEAAQCSKITPELGPDAAKDAMK